MKEFTVQINRSDGHIECTSVTIRIDGIKYSIRPDQRGGCSSEKTVLRQIGCL